MKWLRQSAGDTLVEVIFALVILSSILVTTLSIGRVSRVSGQNSQIRTQAINLVQEQYEALKSFRNSVSFTDFVGNCSGSCSPYYGVKTAALNNAGCTDVANPGSNCIIHMERNSISGSQYGNWVPCPGYWHPPLDQDTTWNLAGASAAESSDSYYIANASKGCRGDARTGTGQPEEQTNISVGIRLLSDMTACHVIVPPATTSPYAYGFQITGTWKQGGVISSDSTSLNTIIANTKGDVPC